MVGTNDDDPLEAALGLGELAGLTINNEADPLSYDVSVYFVTHYRQSAHNLSHHTL